MCETVDCDNCGTGVHSHNITELVNGDMVCLECMSSETFRCDCCSRREYLDDGHHRGGNAYCEECMDDYLAYCEGCDYIYDRDDMHNDGNGWYCEDCYEEERGLINEWDYKPMPDFLGHTENERYYGVELEIDTDDYICQRDAAEHMNTMGVYFKEDGSLRNGFEVVTHPATLEYHNNDLDWNHIVSAAREHGYLSHDVGTCGLHVHISRDAFGSRYTEQDENIEKILMLVEKHWTKFRLFARRTESQLNEWARSYLKESNYGSEPDRVNFCPKQLLETAKEHGRYFAVNLRNSNTVELRLFRGTLNPSTIRATIQMCDALVDLINSYTIDDLERMKWDNIARFIQRIGHKELNDYLVNRGLDYKEPEPQKQTTGIEKILSLTPRELREMGVIQLRIHRNAILEMLRGDMITVNRLKLQRRLDYIRSLIVEHEHVSNGQVSFRDVLTNI